MLITACLQRWPSGAYNRPTVPHRKLQTTNGLIWYASNTVKSIANLNWALASLQQLEKSQRFLFRIHLVTPLPCTVSVLCCSCYTQSWFGHSEKIEILLFLKLMCIFLQVPKNKAFSPPAAAIKQDSGYNEQLPCDAKQFYTQEAGCYWQKQANPIPWSDQLGADLAV